MQQSNKKVKYILVTGGVLSGIGKGVISSSVGRMLKEMGFIVTSIKIDPYINIDAGTMSPFEHGEVYVLDDGGEVDLDLGNYERFLDITLTKDNNITTGKIYNSVIQKERKGLYLGKTVQVVPHICDEIQDWIERVSHRLPTSSNDDAAASAVTPDFCVIELGGTIGDIESMPFVEAMRQFQFRVGKDNFCNIHVSLVPSMGVVGEQKTKPTQNTVRELRALGITPDFIACRSEEPLTEATKYKISSFCHVPPQHVIGVHDVPSVYHVPILLVEQNVHALITERLALKPEAIPNPQGSKLLVWRTFAEKYDTIMNKPSDLPAIEIAIIGKYTGLIDSYTSIDKALKHAAVAVDRKVVIHWIESSDLEDPELGKKGWDIIKNKADGILIPGGFGDRGVEGKIAACNYARTNNIPFFGICLGFQIAVIEYARNILGWKDATSSEFTSLPAGKNVIINMPELDKENLGGTMRLGKRRSIFKTKDCQIAHLYNDADHIDERHRHRYEVNPEFSKEIDAAGLQFVAQDVTGDRMEIFELKNHAYFVGTQYHPEFLSRPNKPSAPFVGLLKASLKNTDSKKK